MQAAGQEAGEHVVLKPLPQRASGQLASLQSASGTPLLHPPPSSSGGPLPSSLAEGKATVIIPGIVNQPW